MHDLPATCSVLPHQRASRNPFIVAQMERDDGIRIPDHVNEGHCQVEEKLVCDPAARRGVRLSRHEVDYASALAPDTSFQMQKRLLRSRR
jgi:hypothetical protein